MFNNAYLDSWAIADNSVIFYVVALVAFIAIGVIAIAINVIRGIAVCKIAKQQKISNSSLSYIPFAQGIILGKMSDDLKKKNKNKKSIIRFILPITTLAKWGGYIALSVSFLGYIKEFALLCDKYPDWIPFAEAWKVLMSFVPSFIVVLSIFAILSLVNHVFFSIASHRVFVENKPTTAVVMTALSVIFGFIMSLIMLFASVKPEKIKMSDYNIDISSKKENIAIH